MRQKKFFYLLALYVGILHLAPILNMFELLPGGKPAFIVDISTLIPIAMSFQYWTSGRDKYARSITDNAVTIYLLLCLLSILLYLHPESPTDKIAYLYGIHYFVLPIFMYYAVKSLNPAQQNKLLVIVCYLNILLISLGLILYYYRPNFYLNFLTNYAMESEPNLKEWQIFGRMQSYLGSTSIGIIAAITIILIVQLQFSFELNVILLPILFLGGMFSFQRAGILATCIALLYAVLKMPGLLWHKAIAILSFVFLLTLGLHLFTGVDMAAIVRLEEKVSFYSFDEPLSETRGYGPGLAYFSDFPLGVGLGGTSSVAESKGLATRGQVVDANFMRILADLGIFGLVSFFFVLWFASKSAIEKKDGMGWLLIIGLTCGVCLVTNILDSYYVSHVFWLLLGVIDTSTQRSTHRQWQPNYPYNLHPTPR